MQLVAEGDMTIDKIECQWMMERFQSTPLRLDVFEACLMSFTALIRIRRIAKGIQLVPLDEDVDVDNQLAMNFMQMQAQHLELAECYRQVPAKNSRLILLVLYKCQLKLAQLNARIAQSIIAHDARVLGIPEHELSADLLMQELNQGSGKERLNSAVQRVNQKQFEQHKLIHE